jgi:2-polyprenyl-3-methyl-5-hydroxy-6-metoxy-1,4-benzoquinol methylase
MGNVTVDINSPSFYSEPNTKFYRFKRKLTMMSILKKIRKIAGKNRTFSLLEIGTGSGFLISFLESEFPKAKLTGIEYDSRLVALTQSKIKNATVTQGNAENFDLKDKRFDIIVSLQVIEHLYQPELMLACVKKHLNKNGIFIFTTPNLEGLGAKCMKNKWHGFRTDHVSLKSYTEWKTLLEQNGFTSRFCGSTFFTGIPIFNKLPFGFINWGLLFTLGSIRWKHGESFIGIFKVQ